MDVTITPKKLKGSITPPPSKSQAHRLLIAAALSSMTCHLKNMYPSKDILATLNCMKQLGAQWERGEVDGEIYLTGAESHEEYALPELDCGESGSTLRFLIPVALALCGGAIFLGHGRLMERPLDPYFDIFDEKGITYEKGGALKVQGRLTPGEYRLAGNVSSQFITGLLYALPLLDGDSRIVLTTNLESKSYIDMTIDALAHFGVFVAEVNDGYFIKGNQTYLACDASVEADYSQSAFFYAMAGIGNELEVTGLNPNSLQGDRVICKHSAAMMAQGDVTIDVSDCPDLVPAMAAQAALREGQDTYIINAARLRIKESDRLAAVTNALKALGAEIEEGEDSLTIHGVKSLKGGVSVDSCNDHRIAMMLAVAATACEQPVTVLGAQCVQKSYPTFWQDYEKLGGQIEIKE